jgi:hypothetical protein
MTSGIIQSGLVCRINYSYRLSFKENALTVNVLIAKAGYEYSREVRGVLACVSINTAQATLDDGVNDLEDFKSATQAPIYDSTVRYTDT